MEKQKNNSLSSSMQKIKLFISVSDEPLPQLTASSQQFGSMLRFYFNDDDFLIYKTNKNKQKMNIFQLNQFHTDIKKVFDSWWRKHDQRLKKQRQRNEEKTFIDFMCFWLEFDKQLKVKYTQFDELVKNVVENQLQNFLLKKFNKSLKNSVKKGQKIKTENEDQQKLVKRLQTIFVYFSRKQPNLNSKATFDELNEIYETLNLAEWLSLIRSFGFYVNGRKEISQKDRSRLKIIFQYFANNQNRINFKQFVESLKAVFYDLYKNDSKESIQKGYRVMGLLSQEEYEQKMKQIGISVPKKIYFSRNAQKPQYSNVSCRYLNHFQSQSLLEQTVNSTSSLKKTISNSKIELPKVVERKTRRKENKLTINLEMISEPDQYLEMYEKKQNKSMGVLKRIDERIEKILSKK